MSRSLDVRERVGRGSGPSTSGFKGPRRLPSSTPSRRRPPGWRMPWEFLGSPPPPCRDELFLLFKALASKSLLPLASVVEDVDVVVVFPPPPRV